MDMYGFTAQSWEGLSVGFYQSKFEHLWITLLLRMMDCQVLDNDHYDDDNDDMSMMTVMTMMMTVTIHLIHICTQGVRLEVN